MRLFTFKNSLRTVLCIIPSILLYVLRIALLQAISSNLYSAIALSQGHVLDFLRLLLRCPLKSFILTLQMFCLQNTQMFVCVRNSRTNIGCFYMYLSVMDNKYFPVVFILNQTLNPLKNKHSLSNLQKIFCCFNKLFSY